ncbi:MULTISPECIES: AAA family ATPase [unclassified Janthinobacterium]|uniref:AAA family ATPase n=1 Tax=unclassified Janthinobacterium TaxID=2610881 RepID=UPI002713EA62|nr:MULTISPECIES: ATP-binding protein [unclassified Janthinobacterium]MDO8048035.1 ATP-binding protein [Janthinobacterium sp. SUN211]MDO8066793.1 ATP-binding protein [Janthinobacterium sp. SUN206]MDO8073067.1 ATP-binding protein [Janthinobacterium sp. SUN176]
MSVPTEVVVNPYRPGAGHRPPYVAGREKEQADVEQYFKQDQILTNIVLTGLRGVGKTVFLDELRKPAAMNKWYWVGTDLSESASISEDNLATRLLADLAVVTSGFTYKDKLPAGPGFMQQSTTIIRTLDFHFLKNIYDTTPGLIVDKLKAVLELSWVAIQNSDSRGVIFAYDEAQNLTDHAAKEQYPLSMLLDLFQSIQRKGIPYMLLLTGLPTLFPKLVEARTYAERMFHVVTLNRLEVQDCRDAITKPIENFPAKFTENGIERICEVSGGYPYFIQFICRESFDLVLRKENVDESRFLSIVAKLDTDFFAGRWARATDRQRDLMRLIAQLPNAENEFSVQEIVEVSKETEEKSFSSSHVNQMLVSLVGAGLIFKNRHGRYAFAVPLLSHFINRQS